MSELRPGVIRGSDDEDRKSIVERDDLYEPMGKASNYLPIINPINPIVDPWAIASDTKEDDEVNSPNHYKVIEDIEAIDIIKELLGPEQFISYCYGNVIKYALRAKKKEAFVKDIGKIKKYCEFIIGD